MSLPDTVFIFVLALIIFGPKKLPEIGRQLGRLVGEFRRASNEFKFQIEEELRQADFNDKRGSQQTIAAPVDNTAQISETSTAPIFPEEPDPSENIAVGQHPNTDTLNPTELNSSETRLFSFGSPNLETANAEPGGEKTGDPVSTDFPQPDTVPAITPAAGAQARTTEPYAAPETDTSDAALSPEPPAPVNSHPAPAEAEITHG